jgi:outer membrane protein OmpA-like peptidoglycan-associated protein
VIQDLEIAPVGTPQVPGQITDGDLVRIRAIAHDPDGDVLVYRWSATAGRWVGIGSEITFDTAGVTIGPGGPPVTVTITVVVDDGRGGTESRSRAITVMAVRRPEPVRQPALFFGPNAARITNLHKAVLDDVADRLRQDPRATLVVEGHQDRAERPSVARTRARNTAEYLIRQRGIDRARIQIRSFDARRPHESGQRRRNRRVELWILPAGAEMPPDSAGSTSRDIAPWREPHLSARARPAEMLSLASSEHPAKEKRRRPLRVMPRVSAHISPPREESDAPPRVGEQVPRAPGERRSENW